MTLEESEDPTELEIFLNKRTDKIYMSRSIDTTQLKPSDADELTKFSRPMRILSKVFEGENHHFVLEGKEVILRVTPKARQEIIAKFYEDNRGIHVLQIQRFSEGGNPSKLSFSFVGDEIGKLYNFIRNIPLLPINHTGKHQFEDKYLDNIFLSKTHLLKFIAEQPEIVPELIAELQKYNLSRQDIKGLGDRKRMLEVFKHMLYTEGYFDELKERLSLIHI